MLKTYKLKDGSMQKSTFWINKNQNIAVSRITLSVEQENFKEAVYQSKDRIDPFDAKKISMLFWYSKNIPETWLGFRCTLNAYGRLKKPLNFR